MPNKAARAAGLSDAEHQTSEPHAVAFLGDELTQQQRAAALREPGVLMDKMALQLGGAGPVSSNSSTRTKPVSERAVDVRRVPDRCVIQAERAAVSVSWFPAKVGHAASGELQIVAWRGVVTMPGQSERSGEPATVGAVRTFHLERTRSGNWRWRGIGGTGAHREPTFSSDDLVKLCGELLKGEMSARRR